jgi:hypothetical protein
MTRIPGAVAGLGRKPLPDIYSVLLLIGVLFLVISTIVVGYDLMANYGLSFGQLFGGVKVPS